MSINSVSFGQAANTRPYGYDPKKKEFTAEQAMKDFKPGIYDPEAQERAKNRKKKIVKTVIGLAALTAGALFLFKTNKGKELLSKGKELLSKLFKGSKETAKTVTDTLRTNIPKAEAMANREFALNFTKNPPKTFKIHSLSVNGGEVNAKWPELIGAARREYMDLWAKADLTNIPKRADVLAELAAKAKV